MFNQNTFRPYLGKAMVYLIQRFNSTFSSFPDAPSSFLLRWLCRPKWEGRGAQCHLSACPYFPSSCIPSGT